MAGGSISELTALISYASPLALVRAQNAVRLKLGNATFGLSKGRLAPGNT